MTYRLQEIRDTVTPRVVTKNSDSGSGCDGCRCEYVRTAAATGGDGGGGGGGGVVVAVVVPGGCCSCC